MTHVYKDRVRNRWFKIYKSKSILGLGAGWDRISVLETEWAVIEIWICILGWYWVLSVNRDLILSTIQRKR